MAGFDEVDPANSCVLGGPSNVWLARRAHDGRADLQPNPERPARAGPGSSGARRVRLARAIRSGKQHACNDLMTGHTKIPSKRNSGKEVLQFAPNFTAYVLPPDVVCLYSEDRKFFLHGELYCALASAIGAGGKSSKELIRTLERNFPIDKIEEAIKRLIERRYVVPASRASVGTVAGYWASLGLPPGIAETNLQKKTICQK